MDATPLHDEHAWLGRMVGEWTSEMTASMAPGEPPTSHGGRERVRALGGAWVCCEGSMPMPDGGTGETLMTLGFDPARGRVVGTFIGSMMTHMWVYDGTIDGDVLTLETEGPAMDDSGAMQSFRDVIEFTGPDERTLTSSTRGADGEWRQFMTASYRRVG